MPCNYALFRQVWMMEQTSPERWWQASTKGSNRESCALMKTTSPTWAASSSPSWDWRLWVMQAFHFLIAASRLYFPLFHLRLFNLHSVDPCCASQTSGVLLSSIRGARCQQASQTETVPAAERGFPLQWPAAGELCHKNISHWLVSLIWINTWTALSSRTQLSAWMFSLQILKLCPKKKSSASYTFCKAMGLLGMQFHLFSNECKTLSVVFSRSYSSVRYHLGV